MPASEAVTYNGCGLSRGRGTVRRDSFLRGALILAGGTLLSRALGAVYRFVLPNLWGGGELAVYGMGLFGLATYPYIVALTLSSMGIPLAVSKLVAERVGRGDVAAAWRVFAVARSTLAALGLTLTLVMVATAPVFGRYYNPDAVPSILAVAPAVLLVSVMSAYRGLFQGLRIMTPYAVSQVVEQIARVVTILAAGALLLPFGIAYAAAGASFGAVAGAVVGLAYVAAALRRLPLPRGDAGGAAGTRPPATRVLAELVRLAVPLSLAGLAYPLVLLVDTLVVPLRLQHAGLDQVAATTAYGSITQIATPLVNVPTAFTTGIALSLMPAVAEAQALGQRARVRRLAEAAFRVTLLLTVPMAAGLAVLARELPAVIFAYPEAAPAIRVLAPAAVFLGIQQMSSAVLQGMGLTHLPVRNLLAAVVLKAVLTWTLTASHGVVGAAVASVLGFLAAGALNLSTVFRHLGALSDTPAALVKPLAASAAMAVAARAAVDAAEPVLGLTLATGLGVAAGAAVYGLVLLAIGGVREEDFDTIPRYGQRLAALLKRLGLLRAGR